jgi:hypothetical protein
MDVTDQDGYTPIHGAAFQGRAIVAKTLMHHGANPETLHEDGFSALHRACWGRYIYLLLIPTLRFVVFSLAALLTFSLLLCFVCHSVILSIDFQFSLASTNLLLFFFNYSQSFFLGSLSGCLVLLYIYYLLSEERHIETVKAFLEAGVSALQRTAEGKTCEEIATWPPMKTFLRKWIKMKKRHKKEKEKMEALREQRKNDPNHQGPQVTPQQIFDGVFLEELKKEKRRRKIKDRGKVWEL